MLEPELIIESHAAMGFTFNKIVESKKAKLL